MPPIATSKTVIANIGTIGSPMGFTKSSTTSETFFNKFAHRNCFGGKRPIIALIEALLWIPDNYGAAPRGAAANKKPPVVTIGGRVLGSSCSGPSIVSPRTPPKGST